jgi:two-component system CheB/CheR fusion protein
MKKRGTKEAGELRRRAEARLRARGAAGKPSARADERRSQHELDVHRVELELQNEELKAARRETEAALESYVSLFDFAPIGYATLDRSGVIAKVNHAGVELLGKTRSSLIGRPFEASVSLRDRPAFRVLLGQALASGSRELAELELAVDHEERLLARLIVNQLPGGERILAAFEDISERKNRERRLAETEAALREVDRRKDEFLAVLSHELRNPLNAVCNSLASMSRAGLGSEHAERAFAVIKRQASLLTRIVDDLLDVTRIARGKIELRRTPVEFGEIVRRTLDDYRPTFDKSGIDLHARLETGPLWVQGDAARLAQVLGNLLANAEKFTPKDGTVVVSLRSSDDNVALSVRDSGVGIEPDVLPHVFESFVQGPQTIDRARGGLGLGLAMVKGIVELHGGSVTVASDGPGRGTDITIALPRASASTRAESPQHFMRPAAARRVLVVEDNIDNAQSLQETLELDGHEVRMAHDGPAAIDLAKAFHPDIVVCDIGLPGMDGYDLARAFRGDDDLKGVPLVALSGYGQPDDVKRAVEAGFDRHLTKPAKLEELERLISEAPELSRPGEPGSTQRHYH